MVDFWDDRWGWMLAGAVGGFVVGVLFAAAAIVLLPVDFFQHSPQPFRARTWASRVRRIAKNVAGIVLILLGIAMLVLPGQGLLTIAVGLVLVDFPGKHALLERCLARPHWLAAANRLRHRFGRPPLLVPNRNSQ